MKQPPKPGKYAVLTAVSPSLWQDFLLFLQSFHRYCYYDLYVIDLWLSPEQIEFIKNQVNAHIIKLSEEISYIHPLRDGGWFSIATWLKPLYFKLVPKDIDYLLWIDVDTVVLKSLGPLFARINDSFLVMTDYFVESAPYNNVSLNNDELYAQDDIIIENEYKYVTVQAGVIGMAMHRQEDIKILDEWVRLVKLVLKDDKLMKYIGCYDQGVLLWVIHKFRRYDCILPIRDWNCPAIRNPYDISECTSRYGILGGDIINIIKHDNPTATIAHYAGNIKLHELIKIDSKIMHDNHCHIKKRRVFILGLEGINTQSLAESVKKNLNIANWVRHEYSEPNNRHGALSAEAYEKHNNGISKSNHLFKRLRLYSRNDCAVICESNHRLAFFIPEITKALNNECTFILVLCDPVQLIKNRLYNFCTWIDKLTDYPGSYQFDIHRAKSPLSSEFNIYRIISPTNVDIISRHLWEINTTLETIFHDASKVNTNITILWLEECSKDMPSVKKLFEPYIDQDLSIDRTHSSRYHHSQDTIEWIESITQANSTRICESIYSVLVRHNCRLPSFF